MSTLIETLKLDASAALKTAKFGGVHFSVAPIYETLVVSFSASATVTPPVAWMPALAMLITMIREIASTVRGNQTPAPLTN